jgi:excisionase family DNA binding protein
MKTERQTTAPGSGTRVVSTPSHEPTVSSRMPVEEVARRLKIGRLAVYRMLEQRIIPGVRIGRRWIITRQAYEEWERTCGMRNSAGLPETQEVTVLN